MKRKILFAMATTALLALGTATAQGATSDGVLGTTSTGTLDVTLTIPELFRISDMDAISFGTYGGSGNLTADDDICVYHNGDGGYRVTVTDDSTLSAASFAVENPAGTEEIPYSISWNDTSGTSGGASVTDGVALVAQTGANTAAQNCSSGGLSANLQVTLEENNLQLATADPYAAQITILVEAD